ncbi:mitochondrial processing peptidase [Malassezia cuniculi]|uniref:Mitochondrial processing peptidase n=1 Tax=Malassezia cuniculi TaxID=948313 RepID=A0AAF0F205_9BASI|nr:mitochondrial processing peptidase [Malassezia cuniculi]
MRAARLAGVHARAGARGFASAPGTQITTLPNRVRVATEAAPGHFSAVGVYIDAGSRFERLWVPGESGVSHMVDRMAFKSTAHRTAEQMENEIQELGGSVQCSSSRETIMYQASVFNQDVGRVLSLLADTIQHPMLDPAELAMQKGAAAWEVSEIWGKPDMIIPELVHSAAYRDNTLGNPLLCPPESLEVLTTSNIRAYMDAWYRPERLVVAGVGMPHEQLVELASEHFGAMRGADLGVEGAMFEQIARARAQYTGGEMYIPKPDLEFTHIHAAFEGLSVHDDDIYTLATLQILLGGGGSFSAGGPGKGMYSRLYTNVLNHHYAVDYCAAFHHCYADSGLFGIAMSVHPSFVDRVPLIIARELELCTSGNYRGSVTQTELSRAKNQLKSSLMMALESRMVEVEDLGRQVQVHGHKVPAQEMCERIDAIDLPTLHRVASRVLHASQPSTVVAQGNIDSVPDVRAVLKSHGLGS